MFWDRFRPFGDHFSAFPTESENRKFFEISTILTHFGPFLALLGPLLAPPKGLGSPKSEGGTGQNGPKVGPEAIKMCFGTALDHLEAILVHFQPNLKIEKISRFRPFWPIFVTGVRVAAGPRANSRGLETSCMQCNLRVAFF